MVLSIRSIQKANIEACRKMKFGGNSAFECKRLKCNLPISESSMNL